MTALTFVIDQNKQDKRRQHIQSNTQSIKHQARKESAKPLKFGQGYSGQYLLSQAFSGAQKHAFHQNPTCNDQDCDKQNRKQMTGAFTIR